ncbi:probable serine/threonine-protein kinase DDB_G0278665 [Procambarus clarkii]|uniref:probable serine/threonine-protein kinase DDB_G0278665 n=1 Tax=Procambarus clarkii TaxID=6728 RepID=UPI0037439135
MEQINREVVDRLLKDKTKFLGSGTYGEVTLVEWLGEPAALKVSRSSSFSEYFTKEAKVLSLLKGAGGAPLLLGVTINPPALLTTYKGSQTLENVLLNSEYNLLDVGLQVGRKLLEIHQAGIVHNDIKCDNVMVQGPPHDPVISLIDFGVASRNKVKIFLAGHPDVHTTYAPEVLQQKASTFASDVFSYGKLMLEILQALPSQHPSLEQILQVATQPNPRRRPSLQILLRRLQENISKISLASNQSSKKPYPSLTPETVSLQHGRTLCQRP